MNDAPAKPTCKTCRHWRAHRAGFHYGECLSNEVPKVTLSVVGPVKGGDFYDDYGNMLKDDDIELKRFISHENFGCVLHVQQG